MLSYNLPDPQHFYPVYQTPNVGWTSTAPSATSSLIPTTSQDYVPQIVAANAYYGHYNIPSSTNGPFPAYASSVDTQFGSGNLIYSLIQINHSPICRICKQLSSRLGYLLSTKHKWTFIQRIYSSTISIRLFSTWFHICQHYLFNVHTVTSSHQAWAFQLSSSRDDLYVGSWRIRRRLWPTIFRTA
jgi:hypothetical protein